MTRSISNYVASPFALDGFAEGGAFGRYQIPGQGGVSALAGNAGFGGRISYTITGIPVLALQAQSKVDATVALPRSGGDSVPLILAGLYVGAGVRFAPLAGKTYKTGFTPFLDLRFNRQLFDLVYRSIHSGSMPNQFDAVLGVQFQLSNGFRLGTGCGVAANVLGNRTDITALSTLHCELAVGGALPL